MDAISQTPERLLKEILDRNNLNWFKEQGGDDEVLYVELCVMATSGILHRKGSHCLRFKTSTIIVFIGDLQDGVFHQLFSTFRLLILITLSDALFSLDPCLLWAHVWTGYYKMVSHETIVGMTFGARSFTRGYFCCW